VQGYSLPYTQNEADWNASIQGSLAGVPKPAKKIIKSVQPWSDPTTPSPLLMLNKLSNIDKHRHCNLALAYSRNTVFRIHCKDGRALEVRPEKPLYLGDVHSYSLPIDPALVASSTRVAIGRHSGNNVPRRRARGATRRSCRSFRTVSITSSEP